jgi:hypothetical protein
MTANINIYSSNDRNNNSGSSISMERRQPQSRRGGGHNTSSSSNNNNNNHSTNNTNADEHGLSFPMKLHTMLEDSDKGGFSNVVSWQAGGKSFKVHNVNKFGNEIMP